MTIQCQWDSIDSIEKSMDHIDTIAADCHSHNSHNSHHSMNKNGDVITSNGKSTGSRPRRQQQQQQQHDHMRNYSGGSEIIADYPQDIFGGSHNHNQYRESTPVPRCEHYRCRSDSCKPLNRQKSTRSNRSTTSSARRRQNEDGCVTCLRGFLHCYNVVILVIGCAALGIGIWQLVIDFGARKVTPIVGNQLYEVTIYLLVAGGGAVALLAFCGCCGTIREDKCVLSFYGTTLAIVFFVFAVACGTVFFFRGELDESIQERMRKSLLNQYGIKVKRDTENRRITEAWDAMQRQLKCCGISGDVNSPKSWFFYSTKTDWSGLQTTKRRVPDSCCKPGNYKLCNGEETFDGPPRYHNVEERSKKNPYLYTEGCYEPLIDYLKTYSMVIGIVAVVLPMFLLCGIIISFCLCARVKGIFQDYEVDL